MTGDLLTEIGITVLDARQEIGVRLRKRLFLIAFGLNM